ncbi:MAG: MarR family transcriptional regulator [Lapillicoccus sp.]
MAATPGRAWPAYELPLLLLGAFRGLVDEAHGLLAERGFPDARPVHGFTLQAVGGGATASEVAARLGITKQAAARTIALLEDAGYVARRSDPDDARRVIVTRTARAEAFLVASAEAFAQVVTGWEGQMGRGRLEAMHDGLARVAGAGGRLDLAGWLGPSS